MGPRGETGGEHRFMETSARREPGVITPRQIYERLDAFVIGQSAAKRAVAIAAYNHLKRVRARRTRRQSLLRKSNLLLIGPTGSGKTHLSRPLAQIQIGRASCRETVQRATL